MRLSDTTVSFLALACTLSASITTAVLSRSHGCPLPPGSERYTTSVPVFGSATFSALLLPAVLLQLVWTGIPASTFLHVGVLAATLLALYLPQWVASCNPSTAAVNFAPFAVFLLLEPILTRNALANAARKYGGRSVIPALFFMLLPAWVLAPRLLLRLDWDAPAAFVLAATAMSLYHIASVAMLLWAPASKLQEFAPTKALKICFLAVGCARVVCDGFELYHFKERTALSSTACNASYLCLLIAIFGSHLAATVHSTAAVGDAKLELAAAALDTASREATAAARSARAQAEQARRRVMRYIFHEIRGPFNSIMLGLEDLSDSEAERLSPDGVLVLDMMSRSASSAKAVLDSVVDFVHMEGGAFKMETGPVRLHDLMQRTVASSSRLPSGVSVTVSTEPTLPTAVAGDAARLQQVLATLTANAVKAAPQDGTGHVQVSLRVIPESLMAASGADEWLVRLPESAGRGAADVPAATVAPLLHSVEWKKPRPLCAEPAAQGLPASAATPTVSITVMGEGESSARSTSASAHPPTPTPSSAAPLPGPAGSMMSKLQSTTSPFGGQGGKLGQQSMEGRARTPQTTLSSNSVDIPASPGHPHGVSVHSPVAVVPVLPLQAAVLRAESVATKESVRLPLPLLHSVPLSPAALSSLESKGYKTGGVQGGASPSYTTILLSVSHNGPCMLPQKLDRFFHAFSMAEAGCHFTSQTTGIGLAVAAEIVRLHGGIVGVGAGPDATGLTLAVMLRLPVLTPRGQSSAAHTGASASSTSQGRDRGHTLHASSSAGSGTD